MQRARAYANDMLRTVAGQNLTDNKPFSLEYLNASIDDCQEYLANNGVTSQIKDNVIIAGLPPVTNPDPAIQTNLSSTGYFNGKTTTSLVTLPQDLIVPLVVWERPTGSLIQFRKLTQPEDGLASRIQSSYLEQWDWFQDQLNFRGATQSIDLRLRYEAAILAISSAANLAQAVIPIRGGLNALAFGVCEYYANARFPGGPGATWAAGKKLQKLDELVNRQVRKDQRISFRPKGFRDDGNTIDGSMGGSYK
jgi:hypothetical protein